ncbi:hypothetical protein OHA37_01960 [Streptomyces sp. NBC_00335]|uniref:hypothetical protein n=1 Tax=unclassified Streptomyces TaxID=2593676 RepID=UPI002256C1A0|nr:MULTISPECIES: hypothetical protein [unclassified Streptomyces]MCX5402650.1 hypothetical protein [Streptomyces sp. NBC_00086]
MTAQSPMPLTVEAARGLQNMLGAEIGPGLSERELDAVQARFGFTFSADHRVFLAAGLPHGSRSWPDWRGGDPEDLAERLSRPVEGVLFDVEHSGFWHPSWRPRPSGTSAALRMARSELAAVPQLVPVYSHRYLPGTAGEWGHPVLSVHQTDIIFYGNDLADYVRHEFTGGASTLPARATVDFWSYFVNGGPATDLATPTPHTPYAVTAQEAVEALRMLALERLIGRPHHPYQLIEAGLTALVLDVETESLPLLAGLSRTEHQSADALFDKVLAELGPAGDLPADDTGIPWEAARGELVRWWLRLIANGSLAPGTGGDLTAYEGWGALARPRALRPLVDRVDAYNDWDRIRRGTREQLAGAIVAEAERLLAGPWPPLSGEQQPPGLSDH